MSNNELYNNNTSKNKNSKIKILTYKIFLMVQRWASFSNTDIIR